MNKKRGIVLICIVIVVIVLACFINQCKTSKRPDIKVPVLLYHNFVTVVPESDPDNFNYINTPQSFEENIKTFLANGYTIISFNDLNNAYSGKTTLPDKPIIITFDDGYYSNYEYIYPILKKYNVKASIFVVTDNIGKELDGIKYLNWDNCLEMQESGLVEIFSHSKNHIFYDKVPVRKLRDDVKDSYREIEKYLGKQKLKVFAYPYGAYTKETVKVLKNIGIDFQVYDLGINNFKNLDKSFIKRINIPCEMTGNEILEEINLNN